MLPQSRTLGIRGPSWKQGRPLFSCGRSLKVVWYVDGFNLYHAVAALDRPILKWLDVASLARSYLREDQELAAVHFFTALNTWSQDKRQRHINVVKALQHTGLTVHTARFDRVDKYCRKAERFCAFTEEKQSDVGIAVQALADAFDGHADVMFFLTADSDQIPTFKRLAMRFPEKRIFLVAPPGRLTHARELGACAHAVFHLTAGRLAQHPLPASLRDSCGRLIASRPSQYLPHAA